MAGEARHRLLLLRRVPHEQREVVRAGHQTLRALTLRGERMMSQLLNLGFDDDDNANLGCDDDKANLGFASFFEYVGVEKAEPDWGMVSFHHSRSSACLNRLLVSVILMDKLIP